MAKKIVVFNQKGGVGKSSTSSNLLDCIQFKGYKVLGIDIDPQGHLSKLLGANTEDENTILEMLQTKRPAKFEDTVQTTKYADIIPCDHALQINILTFAQDPFFLSRVKDILDFVNDKYDYIVIDSAPALNHITFAFLCACDYVLIPTETEYLGMDGVKELYSTITAIQNDYNPNLKTLGILLVKYQPRRNLTKESEPALMSAAENLFKSKVFKTKIKYSVDIPSAQALHLSVREYNPSCGSAKQYMSLAEEVIKEAK